MAQRDDTSEHDESTDRLERTTDDVAVNRRDVLKGMAAASAIAPLSSPAMAETDDPAPAQNLLNPAIFDEYLGSDDAEATWVKENVPLFDCPDENFLRIYYFRWLVFHRRLRDTEVGWVVEEFPYDVRWSNAYNGISAAAGLHIREGRWLRNLDYMADYARYWTLDGINPRHYSFWFASSVWDLFQVHDDESLVDELLQDLVYNYRLWEDVQRDGNGLFWQYDTADAMEFQAGGSGYRPSTNSYMYGETSAIANMAERLGHDDIASAYSDRASDIKSLVQDELWNDDDQFFETMHRDADETVGIREQIGYVPWQFELPDADQGYEVAWEQLTDPEGFHAEYGPTTCERRDPGFTVVDHCCNWAGTSWPYATTQTLVALANLLNDYGEEQPGAGQRNGTAEGPLPLSEDDYFDLLERYTKTQYRTTDSGERIPWVGESVNPLTGEWTTQGGRATEDYLHSSYTDLVISGLVGLRPRPDDVVEVNPLVPFKQWDYFALDNVRYHGHDLTIVYDKDGEHYGVGQGLRVFADGELIAKSGDPNLRRITGELPGDSGTEVTDPSPVEDAEAPGTSVDELTMNASMSAARTPAIHAVDGDETTFWSSNNSGSSKDWLQATFPEERQLQAVTVEITDTWRNNIPEDLDVRYREDGVWQSASGQEMFPRPPTTGRHIITFDEITSDRIRLFCDNGDEWWRGADETGVVEFDWYDDLSDLPPVVEFADQWFDGESVTADLLYLPEGGYVGVYEEGEQPTASASYTSPWDDPALAIDGDRTSGSRWTAYGSPNESDWLQVTLPSERTVTSLDVLVYSDGGGVQPPADYDVQYWDGSAWVSAANQSKSPTTPQEGENTVTFDAFTASEFRVVFEHADAGKAGVVELAWDTEQGEYRPEDLIGVSDYLAPGGHEDVSVPLFSVPGKDQDSRELATDAILTAVPHEDANGNETFDFVTSDGTADGPYMTDGTTVESEVRTPLLARWTFDDTTGDSSSHDHGVSLENGAAFDDQVVAEGSHSVTLDGSDDFVQLSEDGGGFLHGNFTERTVATWVKPDSTSGTQTIYNEGGAVTGLAVRIVDGTLQAGVIDGGSAASTSAPFDRTDWTHVAVVFDRGALRLYVNGSEVAANADVGYEKVGNHGDSAELGATRDSDLWGFDDNHFAGNVDLTSVYTSALSADRIATLAGE